MHVCMYAWISITRLYAEGDNGTHSTSLSCIAKSVNTETMRIKLYCSKSKAEGQQKLIRGGLFMKYI